MIPQPRGEWGEWAIQFVRFMNPWMTRIENGKFSQGQTLHLSVVTVAGLPVGQPGRMVYVSDASGGGVPAFHDGSNWRRVTDRTVVT